MIEASNDTYKTIPAFDGRFVFVPSEDQNFSVAGYGLVHDNAVAFRIHKALGQQRIERVRCVVALRLEPFLLHRAGRVLLCSFVSRTEHP
jgi:hypothetical protein